MPLPQSPYRDVAVTVELSSVPFWLTVALPASPDWVNVELFLPVGAPARAGVPSTIAASPADAIHLNFIIRTILDRLVVGEATARLRADYPKPTNTTEIIRVKLPLDERVCN